MSRRQFNEQPDLDLVSGFLGERGLVTERFSQIETQSGKTLTGLVLEETADKVKLIENPLAQSEPVVLSRAEIVDRAKSPTSIMPKGLLDKLTREEVLDLLAYIVARGDAKNKAFQEGHAHGGGH